MKNEEHMLDEAFEMILSKAATMVADSIGEEAGEPKEPVVFSEEHNKKMEALFQSQRKKSPHKKIMKYAVRAACLLLALVIVSGTAIWSVEAWRVRFLNFVLEVEQPNTDYNSSEIGGTVYSNDEVQLDYVPMGFELKKSQAWDKRVRLKFMGNGQYFNFSVNNIDDDSSLNTEDGSAERITVNGYDAVYTSNPNINAVVWHNNEWSLRVYGNISKEELIKIAENVKILKKS